MRFELGSTKSVVCTIILIILSSLVLILCFADIYSIPLKQILHNILNGLTQLRSLLPLFVVCALCVSWVLCIHDK